MPAPIPDGTLITYESNDWRGTETESPQQIVSAVSAALPSRGLTVRSEGVAHVSLVSFLEEGLGVLPRFSIRLVVQITNNLGYGKADDAASIINNQAFEETDHLPGSWSITSVQLPGQRAQSTGQPSVATTPSDGGNGCIDKYKRPCGSWLSSIEDWFSGLTSKATLGLGLVALGLIVGIILVAQSGSIGKQT